jgi:LPXTG-motif cell wall-anchored protein
MTFRGLLTCSVVLACLLAAAPAFAQSGGAAAPAAPVPQADAAVAAAPEPEGPPAAGATEPEGVAAQEPEPPEPTEPTEPTVPGGEEQPDGAPDGLPEDGAPNGETIAQGGGGTLPRTGIEVLSLAMIGLGLLLAGGALRPTSSWPPPRDRLSRSTTR